MQSLGHNANGMYCLSNAVVPLLFSYDGIRNEETYMPTRHWLLTEISAEIIPSSQEWDPWVFKAKTA